MAVPTLACRATSLIIARFGMFDGFALRLMDSINTALRGLIKLMQSIFAGIDARRGPAKCGVASSAGPSTGTAEESHARHHADTIVVGRDPE